MSVDIKTNAIKEIYDSMENLVELSAIVRHFGPLTAVHRILDHIIVALENGATADDFRPLIDAPSRYSRQDRALQRWSEKNEEAARHLEEIFGRPTDSK